MRLALLVLALFIVALAATTKKEGKRQINHYLPYYGPNNVIEPRQFRPTRTATVTQISTMTYTLTCVKSTTACPSSSSTTSSTSITPTPTSTSATSSATSTATSASSSTASTSSSTASASSSTASASSSTASASSSTASPSSSTASASSSTASASSSTASPSSPTASTVTPRRREIDFRDVEAQDWVNEQLSIVPSNVQGVEATQAPVREGREAAAQFAYSRQLGMIPPFGYYDPQDIQPGFDNDPSLALPYYGSYVQPAAITQPRIFFGALNALFPGYAVTRTETITSFTVIAKTLTSSPTCLPPGIVQCAA